MTSRSHAHTSRISAELVQIVFVAGDLVAILLGLCLGYWLKFVSPLKRFGVESPDMLFSDYYRLILIGTVFLIATFAKLNLYDSTNLLRFRQHGLVILKGIAYWLIGYLSVSLALKFRPEISRVYVFCSAASCLLLLAIWRAAAHSLLKREFLARHLRQRILIIGWSQEADRLANLIEWKAARPFEIVGCLSPATGSFKVPPPLFVKTIGAYTQLGEIIHQHKLDIVILADLDMPMTEIVSLSNFCEKEMIRFKIMPTYFQILVSGLSLEIISGVAILGVSRLPLDRLMNRVVKRCVDLVGAVIGLIVSAPIVAVFGAMIYLESPGSIFYRQVRMGKNGRPFEIIKLRSMKLDAEKTGAQWAQKDDPRRLRVGAFMRAWNVDEIPQFWNVIKGEMSLVGPRPERPELILGFKEVIPHYNARHSTKPGMTGWAQVNGLRGNTSLIERVRYDLFYLENWSLWLDGQILAMTFLRRDNAY
jgi:exopolysaccharide biosynthesis polyprenyl glycosylphosphotransferase